MYCLCAQQGTERYVFENSIAIFCNNNLFWAYIIQNYYLLSQNMQYIFLDFTWNVFSKILISATEMGKSFENLKCFICSYDFKNIVNATKFDLRPEVNI